jgi:uncharacterized protein
MDKAGVEISVIAPVAPRPDQVQSVNDWAASVQGERIVCFGALHPGMPDVAAEVERMIGLGIKGAKLHPNFQEFAPDEESAWPLYEAAQGRLILLFHSGQEIKPVERVYSRPEALARVHGAFPRLTMVVAHMGGYRVWDEVRRHLVGEEVYFDTSYCGEEDLGQAEMRDMIRSHGPERVLFGTDYLWGEVSRDLDRLRAIGLSEQELEAVAWRNAAGLLHLGLGGEAGR